MPLKGRNLKAHDRGSLTPVIVHGMVIYADKQICQQVSRTDEADMQRNSWKAIHGGMRKSSRRDRGSEADLQREQQSLKRRGLQ